jgi:peroxiredoxin
MGQAMARSRLVVAMVAVGLFVIGPLAGWAQEAKGKKSQAPVGKEPPHPPAVGAQAPDFELVSVSGQPVSLRKLTSQGPVVLLVLRGWPGYQCPICTRQVGEFLGKAGELKKHGAEVVMVYPGPAELLREHAEEFQGARQFPATFHFVTDPDYQFTKAWGLRWEAPRETAYPSTFVIGKDNKIAYGVTSTTHGGRAGADAVVQELAKLTAPGK